MHPLGGLQQMALKKGKGGFPGKGDPDIVSAIQRRFDEPHELLISAPVNHQECDTLWYNVPR